MSALLRNPIFHAQPRPKLSALRHSLRCLSHRPLPPTYVYLVCSRHIFANCAIWTVSPPLSSSRMAARTLFPPSYACMHVCTSVSTAFYSASLGLRLRHLSLALPVVFLFFCPLFSPPPFRLISMPCSFPLLLLRPCPCPCSYVLFPKGINSRPSVSRTLMRLSKPNPVCSITGSSPSSRPGECTGLLFVLLAAIQHLTALGSPKWHVQYMIHREPDQSITHMYLTMDFCASFTTRITEPSLV